MDLGGGGGGEEVSRGSVTEVSCTVQKRAVGCVVIATRQPGANTCLLQSTDIRYASNHRGPIAQRTKAVQALPWTLPEWSLLARRQRVWRRRPGFRDGGSRRHKGESPPL